MTAKTKKTELAQTVKGMYDILPNEYIARNKFLTKAKNIAEYYGFKPIHTPYLEKEEIFTKAVGQNTDIVEKQMYSLKTKGGDKLVLRPEGTASIVRAYLQHGMHNLPQPVMFYYDEFFFRHERPQKGRRRELQQLGLEILGSESSITDAIVIQTCLLMIQEAGLSPLKIHINSIGDKECRGEYQKELIAYYKKNINHLCPNCKKRIKTNPFMLLDCKQEKCEEIKKDAPQIITFLCQNCTNHFKELLEILDVSEIPYYLDHYLVRGLDYYTRTVFEVFLDEDEDKKEDPKDAPNSSNQDVETIAKNQDAKNEEPKKNKLRPLAIAGGGRYDLLAKKLGNKDAPGVGCAIGIDRITEMIKEKQKTPASWQIKEKSAKVFFIQIGAMAKQKSLKTIEILRKANISLKHSLSKDGLKSQLKIAAKLKVSYSLILGQKEAVDETIIVKNMETASQEIVPIQKLVNYLTKKL